MPKVWDKTPQNHANSQITNLTDDTTLWISDSEGQTSELSDDVRNSVGMAPRLRRNFLGLVNWLVAKWRRHTYLEKE